MIDKIQAEKLKFVPKKGFNVVGVDKTALPGEALFLVGNYNTREDAQKVIGDQKLDDGLTAYYIYTPDTR